MYSRIEWDLSEEKEAGNKMLILVAIEEELKRSELPTMR